MRHFDPTRSKAHRLPHECLDGVDVGPVDHCIDGQRQADPRELASERPLLSMGPRVARNSVRLSRVHMLNRELDVIEPRLSERCEAPLVQPNPGGDEVRVEAGARGAADELDKIGARGRLAP